MCVCVWARARVCVSKCVFHLLEARLQPPHLPHDLLQRRRLLRVSVSLSAAGVIPSLRVAGRGIVPGSLHSREGESGRKGGRERKGEGGRGVREGAGVSVMVTCKAGRDGKMQGRQ